MSITPKPTPTIGASAQTIVTRDQWGAPEPVDWPPETTPVRGVIIHHTATRNDDHDPMGMIGRVHRFHSVERGWGDIGYSFIVLEDGRIVEGRSGSAFSIAPTGVIAGHAYGHNCGTVGIAVAGRFHARRPTDAAWSSLVSLTANICATCGLDPLGGPVELEPGRLLPMVISGHRDTCETSCPGDVLADLLIDLRSEVADQLGC